MPTKFMKGQTTLSPISAIFDNLSLFKLESLVSAEAFLEILVQCYKTLYAHD